MLAYFLLEANPAVILIKNCLNENPFEHARKSAKLDKFCDYISKYGTLEMLQIAIENGCSFSLEISRNSVNSKNWEMLKWAIEKGCPWETSMIDLTKENEDINTFLKTKKKEQ